MIAIDTNILVRYLTQDDLAQAKIVDNFLKKYFGNSQSIFINNIVLCEVVWVLERGYKYTKALIASAIRSILSTEEFAFEHQNILWIALEEYELKSFDFSDSLIAQINKHHGAEKTLMLDKEAVDNSLFSYIETMTRRQYL
jgi:predicted nucleic-acid-binding protein